MLAHGIPELNLGADGSAPNTERQVWQAAILLVREHGEEAASVAGQEAVKCREGTDPMKYFVWTWITRVTGELIRPEPEPGEYLH